MFTQPRLTGFFGRLLFALLFTSGFVSGDAAPILLITNLPAYGSINDLKGKVLNANPATQAVALFIYVPGYGWVSKPTCGQPLTTIQTDGSWSAGITTGSGDTLATRVAALLVSTNYNEPCVQSLANLPTNIYAQASASAVVTRPSPGVRFVSFSGYDWWVKNFTSPVGPGPNYFSDSTNNVWTDTNGWLHLRITNRSNQWQCAEIVSARTFGFGNYRFELNSSVDSLNPNVTLGLFTWSDDPEFTYREMDVEGGRWNNPADTNNTQFVVQPYNVSGNLVRYRTRAGLTNSTHLFIWETNRVTFQAQAGSYSPNPAASNILSAWVFTNSPAVPHSGDENVRLNFWLFNGNPPTDNHEVEVILKSFQFVPLNALQQAKLDKLRLSAASQIQFDAGVQPDFRYQLQSSSNFFNWQNLTTLLATNDVLTFQDAISSGAAARFYRVVTLP